MQSQLLYHIDPMHRSDQINLKMITLTVTSWETLQMRKAQYMTFVEANVQKVEES
jgi:hypothetical protein